MYFHCASLRCQFILFLFCLSSFSYILVLSYSNSESVHLFSNKKQAQRLISIREQSCLNRHDSARLWFQIIPNSLFYSGLTSPLIRLCICNFALAPWRRNNLDNRIKSCRARRHALDPNWMQLPQSEGAVYTAPRGLNGRIFEMLLLYRARRIFPRPFSPVGTLKEDPRVVNSRTP